MRKIFTIAIREYRAMVGTKAFMVSMVMMPILMFAGIISMELFKDVGQSKERKLAVIDHSGKFYEVLNESARIRAAAMETAEGMESNAAQQNVPGFAEEKYTLEEIPADEVDDALRFELSERIRNQDLYAFVEIPANVLTLSPGEDDLVKFYAEDSSISLARGWIAGVITSSGKEQRFVQSGLAPDQLATFRKYDQPINVIGRGLMKKSSDGTINASDERDVILTLFLPMGIMLLMFMVIFMASQPMLESVLEEKSQRIAEVLLGSANPFQLMMGKLLGTVAGSLTIFAIYLVGVYAIASYRDWTENIPFEIVPWFIVFQIAGVLFYASIFMAVGASVSQLKEAQSLLLPVWMMLMTPLFVWLMIVRDPQGPLALAMSFIPPTAPTTMVLRLATGQTIPLWQPIVSLLLTLVATTIIVVLAGRIFRVGILWQGKTPKITEIMKWAFLGE